MLVQEGSGRIRYYRGPLVTGESYHGDAGELEMHTLTAVDLCRLEETANLAARFARSAMPARSRPGAPTPHAFEKLHRFRCPKRSANAHLAQGKSSTRAD